MKCYFTLGQVHVHRVGGLTLDKDCIIAISGRSYRDCRNTAFLYFGDKIHTQYKEDELTDEILSFYPRGIINI